MPNLARRYTVAEVLAMPEDNGKRYELLDGELVVTPTAVPRHQIVTMRLFDAVRDYLRPLDLAGTIFCLPADISWDPWTLVIPDVFVTIPEELTASWESVSTLLLAVEVVSPSSRRSDRIRKRDIYLRNGVGTYWIVDHEAGVIEVWRPGDTRPDIVSDVLRWRVTEDAPEVAIDLPNLFKDLPG